MNLEQEMSLKKLYKISFTLSILIFLNILFGSVVRATDSSLACPDLSLCYGKVSLPLEFQMWIEMGYRIYSGFIFLVLVYQFFFVMHSEYLKDKFGKLIFTSLLVIVIQILLKTLMITTLLHPTIANLYFLNTVLLLLITVTITLQAKVNLQTREDDSYFFGWGDVFTRKSFFLLIIFALIYFQLYLGGRVSSHHAGLACIDWPTCNGEWFPSLMNEAIRFQIEHRFLAYFIFILIFINYIISILKRYDSRSRFFSKLALYLCVIQIVLGVLNVLWKLPVLLTTLHTGGGVALLVTVYISLYYKISGKKGLEKIQIHLIEEGIELA